MRVEVNMRMSLALLVVLSVSSPADPPQVTAPTAPATQHQQVPRESWQRIPDIFVAMGVVDGAVVADIGAGEGYFTTRLAKAVGSGRVYAVDINDSAIARLGRRLDREGITNAVIVHGTTTDPKLPPDAIDAALIINAYHEMTQYQQMLAAIKTALKPGGRLVIIEAISDTLRSGTREAQEDRHELAPQFVQRDGLDAGFIIQRFEDSFTRRGGDGVPEYLITFTKPR